MTTKEKLVFGAFEVTSYCLIGLGIYHKDFLVGSVGVGLLAVTVVWFVKLARRFFVRREEEVGGDIN